MKKSTVVFSALLYWTFLACGQDNGSLRQVQSISLPSVEGRLDHLSVNVRAQLLFVAGLANNSLEVVDLKAGKRIQSIPGFSKPQGVMYVTQGNKVFVANGNDGTCKIVQGSPLAIAKAIKLDLGVDLMDYDSKTRLLYVGYGGRDAGKENGQFAVVDAVKEAVVSNIQTSAHPGGIAIDKASRRLFLTIPDNNEVDVIDRKAQKIIAVWKITDAQQPVSVALDERNHRLFLGLRKPAKFLVLDSDSGKVVANLDSVGMIDGVSFDPARRRVYVSGGEGFVEIYQQRDADHYAVLGKVPTAYMARTSLYVPELNRLYVAVPKQNTRDAEIRVYEPIE